MKKMSNQDAVTAVNNFIVFSDEYCLCDIEKREYIDKALDQVQKMEYDLRIANSDVESLKAMVRIRNCKIDELKKDLELLKKVRNNEKIN